jgi:peptidoglycan/xylan/chitin deacetylase (PgdA/CDA1 family)
VESYPLDHDLMHNLRERGFEIGIHGLRHDPRHLSSRAEFMRQAERMNRHLNELGAVGLRLPCTLRQPEWMQALDITYDLSFFDTDPFEPIPGGTMSIWPFLMGHFVELPYTLTQDYTLTAVLGETTPRVWMEKVDFVQQYHGMALLNSHPDYLRDEACWEVYAGFLKALKQRGGFWHALPRDVAQWWRARSCCAAEALPAGAVWGEVGLGSQGLVIASPAADR